MASVVIPRLGGMCLDPRYARPGSTTLARNMTFARGYPEGRRGFRTLWSGGNGADQTGMDGPVVDIRHYRVPATGDDYQVIAGYDTGKGLVVTVYKDYVVVASTTMTAASVLDSRGATLYSAQAGDSIITTGPGRARPVRTQFRRTSVVSEEIVLRDRRLVPLAPGDDPGPYAGRLRSAPCIASAFQRVFLGGAPEAPGTLFWMNLADTEAASATSSIDITKTGRTTGISDGDRYLLVGTESGLYLVRGGFTSVEDTEVVRVDGSHGCASARGMVNIGGAHVVVGDTAIYYVPPGQPATVISEEIGPLLRGVVDSSLGADLSPVMPIRGGTQDAPIAWLPGRREVYIALGTGELQELGATPRSLLLVGHIPEPGSSEKVEWSVWDTTAAFGLGVTALCGYVDARGEDTLLVGQPDGSVLIAHVGMQDVIAGQTFAYLTDLVFGPATVMPGAAGDLGPWTQIRSVTVGYDETVQAASGAGPVELAWMSGSAGGSIGATGLTTNVLPGRAALPIFGASFPILMQSVPSHVTSGHVQGVLSTRGAWLALRGRPLPLIRDVTLNTYRARAPHGV